MGAMDDFDRKWQRIGDLLAAEASGNAKPRVASTRSLFGIKSSVEQAMDRMAQEHDEELRAKRMQQRSPEAQRASGERHFDERSQACGRPVDGRSSGDACDGQGGCVS